MRSIITADRSIAEIRLEELFGCVQFGPFWLPDDAVLPPIWKYDYSLNNRVYRSGLRGINSDRLSKAPAGDEIISYMENFDLTTEDLIILEFGSIIAILSCTSSEFGPSWTYINKDDFSQCDLKELDQILAALAARKKRQMLLGNMYGSDIGMTPPWATVSTMSCMRFASNAGFDPKKEVKAVYKHQPLYSQGTVTSHNIHMSGKTRKAMQEFDCELLGYWMKFYGTFKGQVSIDQHASTKLLLNQDLPSTIAVASVGRQFKEVISLGSKHADNAFGICKIIYAGRETERPEGRPPRTVFYLDDPIVTLAPMPKSVKEKADRLGLVTAHPLEPWWLT